MNRWQASHFVAVVSFAAPPAAQVSETLGEAALMKFVGLAFVAFIIAGFRARVLTDRRC